MKDEKNFYMRKYDTLEGFPEIKGYDFEKKFDIDKFLKSMGSTGFQAANLSAAIDVTNQMIKAKSKIFLVFTGNVISSGLRDIVTFLCKHKLVDVIVTNAAGIEEDLIKANKPFVTGSFDVAGRALLDKGVGRIGNIFAPLDRYLYFQKFMDPIFEEVYELQKKNKRPISPTELNKLLGKKINSKSSYLYWCDKNNIDVYCPGIVDGAIGDMMYFAKQRYKDLQLDVLNDHDKIVKYCLNNEPLGAVILGGGIAKHYALNSTIFKDGFDYAVYITTAQTFDGSDSGGNLEEAKSWAKVKVDAPSVIVRSEVTLAFPLLVAGSFHKKFLKRSKS